MPPSVFKPGSCDMGALALTITSHHLHCGHMAERGRRMDFSLESTTQTTDRGGLDFEAKVKSKVDPLFLWRPLHTDSASCPPWLRSPRRLTSCCLQPCPSHPAHGEWLDYAGTLLTPTSGFICKGASAQRLSLS